MSGLRATDAFCESVFHVFAHARLPEAGNIYDPRYVGWAAERLSARLQRYVSEAAEVLERAWAADPGLHELHAFPQLHRDWSRFEATADRPLVDLEGDEVADPALLARLCDPARPTLAMAAEVLHATIAASGPELVEYFDAHVAPGSGAGSEAAERAWTSAIQLRPELAAACVESVLALGIHGRVFGDRILVGRAAPWNGVEAWLPVIVALHEQTVDMAPYGDHLAREWWALTRLATDAIDADAPLRYAHARWLTMLDLDDVVSYACAHGFADTALAARLRGDAESRATTLASLQG